MEDFYEIIYGKLVITNYNLKVCGKPAAFWFLDPLRLNLLVKIMHSLSFVN